MKRTALFALVAAATIGLTVFVAGAAADNDGGMPQPETHLTWNISDPLLSDGDGSPGESTYKNPPSPICSTATSTASNVNTDCEGIAPHNETTIAVNPTNPLNQIGGANDYQLNSSNGQTGALNETALSRAHVTFDGGKTWTMYPVPDNGYTSTGDPAISFDASGRAYYATLGFSWSQGGPFTTTPDILVSTSNDGGKTWSSPAKVALGSGSDPSVGTFNDKEYLTAWGNGNAIVTWTNFVDGIGGSYQGSPIMSSVTHDGGASWSAPVQISGSASFCTGFHGDNACDQDQGSVPTVAADGSIAVAFINSFYDTPDAIAAGRDQYLVVKVDPATGQRVAGPYRVGEIYDGFTDYPYNVDGRPTYQDSEFRTWSVGNITADPTNAAHLAVTWSDMRNSTLPAPSDPYSAKTNSDVIVSQSFDGGATWSSPLALAVKNDQFMPWASYGSDGKLRIGYFDRSYDRANHKYGYTLATEKTAGTLTFSTTQVTTTLSDPTQGDRWFSGRTPNAKYPHPTTFLGDYSGIDASQGFTASLWTDLRNNVCFGGRCGTGEDAFYNSR